MPTNVQARVHSQQTIRVCPHVSADGETWQYTASGKTTSAGSAGGTTLIDTGADSGGNVYAGRYWVKITTGSNRGQWKRCVLDNGSGTLTFEGNGFDNQVASGVSYEIWKSPEPVVVVDSSASADAVVDAIRTEADDYWNGMYAICIYGTNSGEVAQISDFVNSTNTMSFTTKSGGLGFTSQHTAGDILVLGYFVDAAPFDPSGLSNEYQPRVGMRSKFTKGDGAVGPRGGSISLQTNIIPSGNIATSGLQDRTHLWPLLQASGLEPIQLSATATDHASGASSTTQLEVTTATASTDWLGAVVGHNGNYSVVTSFNDGGGSPDSLNITPALPVAPDSAETINVCNIYKKSTDGDVLGCVVESEIDGYRTIMTGCKGNVNLAAGPLPTLDYSLNVDHWVSENERSVVTTANIYSTAQPVLESDRIAYLDSTRANIGNFTATPGTDAVPRAVEGDIGINGRAGYQIRSYDSRGTYREILQTDVDLSELAEFEKRTSYQLFVLYGNDNGHFGVVINTARRVEAPMPGNADGIVDAPAVWEAQDAGYANSAKYPDFLLFID